VADFPARQRPFRAGKTLGSGDKGAFGRKTPGPETGGAPPGSEDPIRAAKEFNVMKGMNVIGSGFLLGALILCTGCPSEGYHLKSIIQTDAAPEAIGPYSQAVMVRDTLYLSGQIAIDPATGELIRGDIEKETHRVLKNIGAILEYTGLRYDDVVKVQIFLKDMDHYGKVNEIYKQYFTKKFPARAVVQVAKLPKDVSIEISAIALRNAGW
jgi:2-iminobutanoate/2-iminopropanoate deaminase